MQAAEVDLRGLRRGALDLVGRFGAVASFAVDVGDGIGKVDAREEKDVSIDVEAAVDVRKAEAKGVSDMDIAI